MGAIRAGAVTERDSANPQPPDPTDTTTDPGAPEAIPILDQIATFAQSAQDLYAQMGNNFIDTMRPPQRSSGFGASPYASARPQRTVNGGVTEALQGGNRAAAAGRTTAAMTSASRAGVTTSTPLGGGSAGTLGTSVSGPTQINVENISFPVAPSDPHTFSKNLLWELQAMG
jgi:hypothetical protein